MGDLRTGTLAAQEFAEHQRKLKIEKCQTDRIARTNKMDDLLELLWPDIEFLAQQGIRVCDLENGIVISRSGYPPQWLSFSRVDEEGRMTWQKILGYDTDKKAYFIVVTERELGERAHPDDRQWFVDCKNCLEALGRLVFQKIPLVEPSDT